MQMERLILLMFLVSCGEGSEDSNALCRPQDIAIAECIIEEYEKNPSRLLLEYQRQNCQRRYPFNTCYYK